MCAAITSGNAFPTAANIYNQVATAGVVYAPPTGKTNANANTPVTTGFVITNNAIAPGAQVDVQCVANDGGNFVASVVTQPTLTLKTFAAAPTLVKNLVAAATVSTRYIENA